MSEKRILIVDADNQAAQEAAESIQVAGDKLRERRKKANLERIAQDASQEIQSVLLKKGSDVRPKMEWQGGIDDIPMKEVVYDERGGLEQVGDIFILDEVGEGQSGRVFLGVKDGEVVAVKQVTLAHREVSGYDEERLLLRKNVQERLERTVQEAKTLREHHHPNVLRLLDLVRNENSVYMITDYYERDLKSFKDTLITLDPKKEKPQVVTRIGQQLVEGLRQIHKGHLHRDLKPANILMNKRGQVVIADFGVARKKEKEKKDESIVGTLEYLPPEALKENEYTEKSEIFMLGATLYECITGELPLIESENSGRYLPMEKQASLVVKAQDLTRRFSLFGMRDRRNYRNALYKNLRANISNEKLIAAIVWALEPLEKDRPTLSEFGGRLTSVEKKLVSDVRTTQKLIERKLRAFDEINKSTRLDSQLSFGAKDLEELSESTAQEVLDYDSMGSSSDEVEIKDTDSNYYKSFQSSDGGEDIEGVEDSQEDAYAEESAYDEPPLGLTETNEYDPNRTETRRNKIMLGDSGDLRMPEQNISFENDLTLSEEIKGMRSNEPSYIPLGEDGEAFEFEEDSGEEEPLDPTEALRELEGQMLEAKNKKKIILGQLRHLGRGDKIHTKKGRELIVLQRKNERFIMGEELSNGEIKPMKATLSQLEEQADHIDEIDMFTGQENDFKHFLQSPQIGDQIVGKNGKIFLITEISGDEVVLQPLKKNKTLGAKIFRNREEMLSYNDSIKQYIPQNVSKKQNSGGRNERNAA